jgi:hypothetical protein
MKFVYRLVKQYWIPHTNNKVVISIEPGPCASAFFGLKQSTVIKTSGIKQW